MASDHDDEYGDLFQDPEGFYQGEKPFSFQTHTLKTGVELKLRLVGHNPLWGHILWNAGKVISDYIENLPPNSFPGKYVLEFGAGAGLPSLVSSLYGAAQVVVTDYPDQELIENLQYNIQNCCVQLDQHKIAAEGFLWGASPEPLKAHLPRHDQSGFNILILADLLFNHSEHGKLVQSVLDTMIHHQDSYALVFFTPYRPWLLEKDLAFFDLAKQHGLAVEKLFEDVMDKALFENDPGDEKLRRTVYAYKLRYST
ncbi:hypothetical protein BT63DRAFT_128691 [Microthyrium microscopicum]|uniref:Protein N-terminal and lysine N-methyltransferase EFM7 n=1 Tax=Microthyrium microscopicum TaxID=703497 RepID=A0A6A6TT04_9PEZI|nr:hypothetical protein BT63DRAFT_128691 [Microthyrium microscopicum]